MVCRWPPSNQLRSTPNRAQKIGQSVLWGQPPALVNKHCNETCAFCRSFSYLSMVMLVILVILVIFTRQKDRRMIQQIRTSPSLSLSLSFFDANEYSLRKSKSCSESFTHITDKTQKWDLKNTVSLGYFGVQNGSKWNLGMFFPSQRHRQGQIRRRPPRHAAQCVALRGHVAGAMAWCHGCLRTCFFPGGKSLNIS